MKVFVIGGTGYIGAAACRKLVERGHDVTALSRSAEGDAALALIGAVSVRGDVAKSELVTRHAAAADCTLWASTFDMNQQPVLEATCAAIAGAGGGLVYTSGTAMMAAMTDGELDAAVFAEDTPFVPTPIQRVRVVAEQAVLTAAARGGRTMVMRPPLVYGNGGSSQIPALFESGIRTGKVRYVGRGLNRWSFIHINDLSELFAHAIERGPAGAVYHMVAGEADFRSMAEAAGRAIGLPAEGWPKEISESEAGYGKFMSRVVLGSNSRTTSSLTEAALNWSPQRSDLLEDIEFGSYRARFGGGRI